MSGVRLFRAEDIPAVVELRPLAFRVSQQRSPEALTRYFQRVFLEAPSRDPDLPSLVWEDHAGRVRGFIGVVPRQMRLGDARIRVAVPTQFMVHPENRGVAGVQLMRQFLAGPQDLALSDRGNDGARLVWERLGGSTALLFSLFWTRPLRPARFGAVRHAHSRLALNAIAATGPLWSVIDAVVGAVAEPAVPRQTPPGRTVPLDLAWAAGNLPQFLPPGVLQPAYDHELLQWLLDEVAAKTRLGALRALQVRGTDDAPVGWFVYFANPRGFSQVVMLVARPERAGEVLAHLVHRAAADGATGVLGRMEPLLLADLGAARCRFDRDGPWMLAHARDPDVLNAVLSGRAFISRLDSEWWLNF